MEQKNYGVVLAPLRPTDYILGSISNKINITRMVKDWSLYLPILESQENKIADFEDCVTMSGGHAIEMQLNYLLFQNLLSDEALNFFHNNNYIVDGLFRISKRFNAKLNGTEVVPGNNPYTVGDNFRTAGFVPESSYPTTDNMTWAEFYSPIPQNLIDLGKKALWFILVQYQFVLDTDILPALYAAPVQCATEVCAGWESGQPVKKCSGQPLQHATVIYGKDSSNNWLDFDQLPPFLQKLAPDYELPLNMQYIITMKPTTLRKTMFGANVTFLQEDLNKVANYKLDEDGTFGNLTEKAVIDFQKKHGLVADGIAGSKTLAKLKDTLETPLSIKDIITNVCNENGVEPELAIAVARHEGGLTNPKITRQNTDSHHSIDRGIFQYNSYWLSYIPDSVAFDVALATKEFCDLVKQKGMLHQLWYISEPNWKKDLSPAILLKYGIT